VLESIAVTPATSSVAAAGGTQQYTATGKFSDATTQNLTATVTWAAADASIAQLSNAAGSQGLATGVAAGTTAISATSGSVVGTASITVVAPKVVATSPSDGSAIVSVSIPIVITFNQAIAPSSLTTQTAAGPCSGSLQLSADNFASCVGFAGAAPAMNAGNTIATAIPSPVLQTTTTYRIRVLGTVTNAGGLAIGTDVTQATGFTTAGFCATKIVISQVYGGGGNSGAQFRNDFIELHNVGTTPVSLTGLAVQFASAGGATFAVQALPSATIPPGGYFLIQESAGANTTLPFPTADFVPSGTGFAIGATSGKVALTSTTTAITGSACPSSASIIDLVGFGSGLSCFEGTAGAPAPSNTTSVQRNNGGCDDTNENKNDFTTAIPVPRNASTTAFLCACSAGPAGGTADNVSFPDADEVSLP